MKKTIILVVISVLLVGFCIGSVVLTKEFSKNYLEKTDKLTELIKNEDFKTAEKTMEDLKNEWNSKEPIFAVCHNSNDLHDIECQLEKIDAMIKIKSDELLPEISVCRYQIIRLELDETLTVESWF